MDEAKLKYLLERRKKLLDRRGGWLVDEGVFSYGHDLLREMLPNKSYFHVVVLNALGFVPEDKFCKWLDAIFICLSWPDPRIWCNGVGSFAGSANTTALAGTAAGMLASDSVMYGPNSLIYAARFMIYANNKIAGGSSVPEFVENEIRKTKGQVHLMGFARPIAKGDERVEAMLSYTDKLGFEIGEHLSIGLEIEEYLIEKYNESMNVGGYMCAFMLDQGLSPEDIYLLLPSLVNSGVTARYNEERERPENAFLPQTCSDVTYSGVEARSLPAEYVDQN